MFTVLHAHLFPHDMVVAKVELIKWDTTTKINADFLDLSSNSLYNCTCDSSCRVSSINSYYKDISQKHTSTRTV